MQKSKEGKFMRPIRDLTFDYQKLVEKGSTATIFVSGCLFTDVIYHICYIKI